MGFKKDIRYYIVKEDKNNLTNDGSHEIKRIELELSELVELLFSKASDELLKKITGVLR